MLNDNYLNFFSTFHLFFPKFKRALSVALAKLLKNKTTTTKEKKKKEGSEGKKGRKKKRKRKKLIFSK